MALIKFNEIGIHSISVTVPKERVETMKQTELLNEDQLTKFIETTGVKERRIAPSAITSSDLCFHAANELFEATNFNRKEVDALIFISQTPDYRVPGSSLILQNKLNLPTSTLAFDINLTCSAYIYGLYVAYSLVNCDGIHNVLLLVGETLSKIISNRDKSTGLLLGDGGSATMITKNSNYDESFFSLNTDGKNFKSVIVPAGGFRTMTSDETRKSKVYEDGSERSDEQLSMDGMDVFSFAVSEMPKDVKRLLNFAQKDLSYVNKVIFHQSNKFMMDFIAKKAKVDPAKMIYSIQNFGNTSGVSIPSAIVDQKERISNNDIVLLNAIGAGFSYGSAIVKLADTKILKLNEI